MRKVCEFVSFCESWWWFGRILCFLSAYNQWFLILIGRFLGGGGCFCFVFFSHSTLYFPLAFVFSAGDYLVFCIYVFVNNGSSLHNELHIKCLRAINLSKNQLICKYIIASPGNQVKKKISDFPWVIDLLSPVKKMCVI